MCSKQKHKTRSRKTYKNRLRMARWFCGGYTISVQERKLNGLIGKGRYGRGQA